MSKWQKSISFANQNRTFRRSEFVDFWRKIDSSYPYFDEHLTILTRAGFLMRISRGLYKRVFDIPENYSSSRAKQDAYNRTYPFINRGELRKKLHKEVNSECNYI